MEKILYALILIIHVTTANGADLDTGNFSQQYAGGYFYINGIYPIRMDSDNCGRIGCRSLYSHDSFTHNASVATFNHGSDHPQSFFLLSYVDSANWCLTQNIPFYIYERDPAKYHHARFATIRTLPSGEKVLYFTDHGQPVLFKVKGDSVIGGSCITDNTKLKIEVIGLGYPAQLAVGPLRDQKGYILKEGVENSQYNTDFYFGEAEDFSVGDEAIYIANLLAPITYMDKDERFYPSSVELPPQNKNFEFEEIDSKQWLVTKEELDSPSEILDFFRTKDSFKKNAPPYYVLWVNKERRDKDGPPSVIQLSYFMYYYYNRGKEVLGGIWGSHVGDWENVTIYLKNIKKGEIGNYPRSQVMQLNSYYFVPDSVRYEAHGDSNTYQWRDPKLVKHKGTHVVVFSAEDSHGTYPDAGSHAYKGEFLGKVINLTDETSQGDLWLPHVRKIFNLNICKQQILNSEPISLPSWLSENTIYRWGNEEEGCNEIECRLTNGPTGPLDKGVIKDAPFSCF